MAISRTYIRPATQLTRVALSALGIINITFAAVVLYRTLAPDLAAALAAAHPGLIGVLTQLGVGVLFSVLGVFLLGLSGHRPGVILLSGFLLSQGLAIGFLMVLGIIDVGSLQFSIARILINWLAYSFAIRTVQLFPRRINRTNLIEIRPLGPLTVVVDMLRGPIRVWSFTAAILAIVVLTQSELLFHLGQLLVILVTALTLIANYRLGGRRIRRKIYWLLLGTLILLIARLLLFSTHFLFDFYNLRVPGVRSVTWAIANVGLLSCILIAVFYRGAVDPRIVVRRAAVYSLSIIALLFTFAAFENYLSGVLTQYLGLDRGSVAAVGGAATALLIKPLIDLLSRIIERALPAI